MCYYHIIYQHNQIPTQTLAKFNNIYGHALALIDRITLTSRSGVILADIPNTHIFGSLVSSVNTKISDLLNRNSQGYGLRAGATTDHNTAGQDATSQATALVAAQLTPVSDLLRCNASSNFQISAKIDLDAAILNPVAFPHILNH